MLVLEDKAQRIGAGEGHGERLDAAYLTCKLACLNINLVFEIAEATIKAGEISSRESPNH
jgi:hypothetical protein